MADHQFGATSLFVRDAAPGDWDPNRVVGGAPVGPYVNLVQQHLATIQATPAGGILFTAITAFGRRQVIRYNGENVPNENAAFGPGAGANKIIRQRFGDGSYAAAGAELNLALMTARAANPAHDMTWFCTQLLTTRLHSWNPATTPANSPLNPAGAVLGTPAFTALLNQLISYANQWVSGRLELREAATMDLIVLILEPHLRNGVGGSTLIHYNPLKTHVGGVARRPESALFHELVHAYYNAQGSQLSQEDSTAEHVGRYYELMAVGLPPFNGRPYSENVMRAALGDLPRTQY